MLINGAIRKGKKNMTCVSARDWSENFTSGLYSVPFYSKFGVDLNLILCIAVLSGRVWVSVVMKGTLICAVLLSVRKRGKKQSKPCRKLTQPLDFAKVSSRRNIIAFTVLLYRKFRYGSLGPGPVVWTRETGK